jgi:hypothetical protein
MTFLRGLLLDFLTQAIEKAAGALRAWADDLRQQAAIRRAAKAEREATELAKTEQERTHAADNSRRL